MMNHTAHYAVLAALLFAGTAVFARAQPGISAVKALPSRIFMCFFRNSHNRI
jgi:hypothetical protein